STEILLWAAPARRAPLPHPFHYRDMKAENGGKQMRDLWQFPEPAGEQVVWSLPTPAKREKQAGRHPTQKPLALLDRIVRAGSSPGEVGVGPFNGSGAPRAGGGGGAGRRRAPARAAGPAPGGPPRRPPPPRAPGGGGRRARRGWGAREQ